MFCSMCTWSDGIDMWGITILRHPTYEQSIDPVHFSLKSLTRCAPYLSAKIKPCQCCGKTKQHSSYWTWDPKWIKGLLSSTWMMQMSVGRKRTSGYSRIDLSLLWFAVDENAFFPWTEARPDFMPDARSDVRLILPTLHNYLVDCSRSSMNRKCLDVWRHNYWKGRIQSFISRW